MTGLVWLFVLVFYWFTLLTKLVLALDYFCSFPWFTASSGSNRFCLVQTGSDRCQNVFLALNSFILGQVQVWVSLTGVISKNTLQRKHVFTEWK